MRVFNNSGELYDNAQTRLVVGTINLVEKIADLATRPPARNRPAAGRPDPDDETAGGGMSEFERHRRAP